MLDYFCCKPEKCAKIDFTKSKLVFRPKTIIFVVNRKVVQHVSLGDCMSKSHVEEYFTHFVNVTQ